MGFGFGVLGLGVWGSRGLGFQVVIRKILLYKAICAAFTGKFETKVFPTLRKGLFLMWFKVSGVWGFFRCVALGDAGL